MQSRVAMIVAAVALLIPATAWALGSDHPKGPIHNDKWPKGLAELVNAENRVHGFFVNSEDVLFFRGDTAALNAFLEKYAGLADTRLKVVIHPGKLDVKSPWDKEPRDVTADWKLYVSPFTRGQVRQGGVKAGPFDTRVDVWLGGRVELQELRVPRNVVLESGGEIEAFVRAHREALQPAGKLTPLESEHTEWLAQSLLEMQSIKPGMTREDLLKVFQEEGGLSTRTQRRYAYRECPYIKSDVKFEPVGATEDRLTESPKDRITQISQPFLEWTIAD